MSSLNDLQKVNQRKDQEYEDSLLACPTCNFTWWEEVEVKQYFNNHSVVLGQALPGPNQVPFKVLRCIKCKDLTEPRILRTGQDKVHKQYDKFLDGVQGADKVEKV